VCGIKFAKIFLESLGINITSYQEEGKKVKKGDLVLELRGKSKVILSSERIVLNLIMRLSGIATQTHKFVKKVEQSGQDIIIAATRKTTPGFRYFEKYAVFIGGGDPHRWSLSDTILIKENHLKLFEENAIKEISKRIKNKVSFSKKIEIEVENLDELKSVLSLSPDIIMLDNFKIKDIQEAIKIVQQTSNHIKPLIEVSGGISEKNIDNYIIPGVNIISIGALTHSVTSMDFSLKIKDILNSEPNGGNFSDN
ncbi:MAG: carboxylating nicotinate-nucleotide diphosphorylase, partial [Candidatus Hodarchaeota archaeon]